MPTELICQRVKLGEWKRTYGHWGKDADTLVVCLVLEPSLPFYVW